MNPDDLHASSASLGSLKASPHEAFSLMLLERLEKLEDAHRALQEAHRSLQENVRFKITHEWYKITFKVPVSAGDDAAYYTSLRIRWINQLFSQRARYEPTFAYWHWFIEGTYEDGDDMFHIHAYIRFKNYTTLEDIRSIFLSKDGTVIHSAQPFPGGVAELKMILTERAYYNQQDFFDSTDDYGVDMWRRGGEAFDSPAPTEWTEGDFLDSPEYRPPSAPDRQIFLDYLRLTIQQKRWMALFQEEI